MTRRREIDSDGRLLCVMCKERKETKLFYRKGAWFRSYCIPCDKKAAHAWDGDNKDKHNESSRSWHKRNPEAARSMALIRNYGISASVYREMFLQQGGACAICGRGETALYRNGRNGHGAVRSLSVDHDHSTGRVRGLLCHKCNVAVGVFDADMSRVKIMVSYLSSTVDWRSPPGGK